VDLRSLEIKISRSENLPVLPEHVSQILKLVDKPYVSPSVMEAIVQRDAAVTAKILRVANSPFYGLTPCTSISRAMHSLGANQVRSLVIGVAYQQAIGTRSGSRLLDKHALWQHSLATAVAARFQAGSRRGTTLACCTISGCSSWISTARTN
jgi:HD-like signal output (HDOD) protein